VWSRLSGLLERHTGKSAPLWHRQLGNRECDLITATRVVSRTDPLLCRRNNRRKVTGALSKSCAIAVKASAPHRPDGSRSAFRGAISTTATTGSHVTIVGKGTEDVAHCPESTLSRGPGYADAPAGQKLGRIWHRAVQRRAELPGGSTDCMWPQERLQRLIRPAIGCAIAR
jgi:hypothetical protein